MLQGFWPGPDGREYGLFLGACAKKVKEEGASGEGVKPQSCGYKCPGAATGAPACRSAGIGGGSGVPLCDLVYT